MSRLHDLYTLAMQREASAAQLDELMSLLADANHEADNRQLLREAMSEGYAHGTPMASERIIQIKQAIVHGGFAVSDEATPTADLKSAANNLPDNYPDITSLRPAHRVHLLKTAWLRYAAILLLLAGFATFLYNAYHDPQRAITKDPSLQQSHIQHGGNKAILTLSDGSTIVLDSAANGALAQQGSTRILKVDAGSLAYQAGTVDGEVMYNTITTPKGGQYQITLPDGTRVWLNAASSIHFPTVFNKDRRVAVTGEVYFEVARHINKPFVVASGVTEVMVLGTAFNINAYNDEPVHKTTLLQGSVKIIRAGKEVMLRPGEQAETGMHEPFVKLNTKVDTEKVVAWKNGIFNFEDLTVHEALRQLARWYDLKIIYESQVGDRVFGGMVGRNLDLGQVLEGLNGVVVHLRLEGRTLYVRP